MRRSSILFMVGLAAGCGGQFEDISESAAAIVSPAGDADPGQAPGDPPAGVLCTPDCRDFDEYRYAEQIAHCKRHVTQSVKLQVAARYHVPKSDFGSYEFDHFIPLSIGGSNDVDNLWPQPRGEADEKDRLEQSLYLALAAGRITQAEAVQQIRGWTAH